MMADRDPVWDDPKTYDWDYAFPPVRMSVFAWERSIVAMRKSDDPVVHAAADLIEHTLQAELVEFDRDPQGAVFEIRVRKKAPIPNEEGHA